MNAREGLLAVADFFEKNPGKWITGNSFSHSGGGQVCINGALYELRDISGDEGLEAHRIFARHVTSGESDSVTDVFLWNDAQTDVQVVIDTLREAAR